jgi:mRNA interferase HigB
MISYKSDYTRFELLSVCKLRTFIINLEREAHFSKRTIRIFWEKHPDSKVYLQTWFQTVKSANWKSPNDIKDFYATVSILKNSRGVFNIKGNNYWLVARINYNKQWLFVRFIGTHEEYDRIDANSI